MDISIARSNRSLTHQLRSGRGCNDRAGLARALERVPSSRHDVRQPRLGQLQFGGVNRRAIACACRGRRQLARLETGGDRLQRMTRLDLRVTPLVRVLADALARRRRAPRRAPAFSMSSRALVDRLERQLRLEARVRRGVELARALSAGRAPGRRGSSRSTADATARPTRLRMDAVRSPLPASGPPGRRRTAPSGVCLPALRLET